MIATQHEDVACVAAAVQVDNMSDMETVSRDNLVITTITGIAFSRVIATVDDYLMNLTVADEMSTSRKVK
jgi:hypothetical protein